MSDDAVFHYRFTDDSQGKPLDGWQSTGEFFRERDARITHLYKLASRTPPLWAQDLLRIARVVYLADKLALRRRAPDGWTRAINLEIQLADPDAWVPLTFEKLLNTLTSDVWKLKFTNGATPRGGTDPSLDILPQASEVALFSGGLDSAAYAAYRASGDEPLVLVAHYSSRDKGQQRYIYEAIPNHGRTVFLRQFPLQVTGSGARARNSRENKLEPSTRSRGLLFIAAAVFVAAAYNVRRVTVPENGPMALNPSLAADRVGACSSRSVHPTSLKLINLLIREIGGDIDVVNPFMTYTKAGVCSLANSCGLAARILARTVSCGRPPNKREGGSYDHCGCCLPCLVRRAGLWTALNGGDLTLYKDDPWNLPDTSKENPKDLIAVLHWLATPFQPHDLVADMPLPVDCSLTEFTTVIEAGRQEMGRYLDAVLPAGSEYRGWLVPESART